MYCDNCGKQLDDDSKYCKFCGKAISSTSQNSENSLSWEYCQIMRDGKQGWFSWKIQFWASAIGKRGQYNAGVSNFWSTSSTGYEFSQKDRRRAASEFQILVNKLLADGWEPTGEIGPNWWSQKFRRREKA